jgi:alpha-ketoglutarate-dependent taurine dioxygenase
VSLSEDELIRTRLLEGGGDLPLVITPAASGINLEAWAASNREFIDAKLLSHGAILFRGFDVNTAADFRRLISVSSGELLEYKERSSPRSHVADNIYTSTEYPPDQRIFLHNENSYQQSWPLKIFFFCDHPPSQGGETPIADCRKVLRRISPETQERFKSKKIMYVRNFGSGFGLPWQTVFQTQDKAKAEQHCRLQAIEWEWLDGDRLRTRQIRPVFATHPRTQESVWFNHTAFFHISTLNKSIAAALLREFKEEDLPANTYYGDGSGIEPEVLDELREAYSREAVAFPWEKGDVLMLDNMFTAHGRAPFTGTRRILVGMAEMIKRTDD